jgi:hypothetical protein
VPLPYKRQPFPDIKCVYGIDAEVEVMVAISEDPAFIKETEDLVPLMSLAGIDIFDGMSEEELRMQQKCILARLIMKMVYEQR